MSDKGLTAIAQRRALWQRLKEKANVSNHLAERFSNVYKEHMETLRKVDDEIREIAKPLKRDLVSANKAFKDRRFPDVAHWLASFNDSLKLIVAKSKVLEDLNHDYLDDFYSQYQDAEDPTRDYFPTNEVMAALDAEFIKESGLFDLFKNDRARAAKALEKIHTVQTKQRQAAITKLLNKADGTLNEVLNIFSELDKARASGNITQYLHLLQKMAKYQSSFENKFKDDYNQYIKPLIERVKKEKEEFENTEKLKKLMNPNQSPEDPNFNSDVIEQLKPLVDSVKVEKAPEVKLESPVEIPELEVSLPKEENLKDVKDEAKDEVKEQEKPKEEKNVTNLIQFPTKDDSALKSEFDKALNKSKAAAMNEKFYNELVKVAKTNDVYLMGAMIAKYSGDLEDLDEEASLKLLAIAEAFLNE